MSRFDEELKVYLHREAVDFRLSINGLAVLVEQALALDPFASCAYVFSNRRRDRVKILGWECNGFWLLLKRLEKDRFIWPSADAVPTLARAQRRCWLDAGSPVHRRLFALHRAPIARTGEDNFLLPARQRMPPGHIIKVSRSPRHGVNQPQVCATEICGFIRRATGGPSWLRHGISIVMGAREIGTTFPLNSKAIKELPQYDNEYNINASGCRIAKPFGIRMGA